MLGVARRITANTVTVAAIAEILTGLALLVAPTVVGHLLLGEAMTAMAVLVARVAGLALVGLGMAFWPGPPIVGMIAYSTGVAILLSWFWLRGEASGLLLWPAVMLHVILAVVMLWSLAAQNDDDGEI